MPQPVVPSRGNGIEPDLSPAPHARTRCSAPGRRPGPGTCVASAHLGSEHPWQPAAEDYTSPL
ncbi:hypothetical protein BVI1335_830071 [Burkholderia vietnamiensis]|nr:hypothetical protein BVI1335_830071 [Burkholderia vietnamiensis]